MTTSRRKIYEEMIKEELEKIKVEDFCKEYQFDKIGDREYFNDRFNDPYLKPYLFYDRTPEFFREIIETIKIGANIIIFIYGPRNMGKSEIAQSILLFWKEMFRRIRGKEVNSQYPLIDYVGFSDAEMGNIFRKMKEGDMAIRDETPNQSGAGASTDAKNLENICNITREFQVSFCFCNPKPIKEEGVDYYLEVAGKNKENRTIRCIWYDRRHIIMGTVYFSLHDDEDFRKQYSHKKRKNIRKTLAFGGGTYHLEDQERLLKDCINLFHYCLSRGVTSKTKIKTQLNNYNMQFDPGRREDADKMIVGTKEYIETVIDNVHVALNPEKFPTSASILKDYIDENEEAILQDIYEQETQLAMNFVKQEDIGNSLSGQEQEKDIKWNKDMTFPEFCYHNIPDERIARVAMCLARGDSYNVINDNFPDLSYNFIRETSKTLRQEGYEYQLGYLFEQWYALKLGVPKEEVKKVVAKNERVPDLIWKGKIYSLKFRYDKTNKALAFSQTQKLSSNFYPEYLKAKEWNTKYTVVFLNPKWTQDVIIREVDPIKDPEVIYLRKPQGLKELIWKDE